jgi:hypothetical protein
VAKQQLRERAGEGCPCLIEAAERARLTPEQRGSVSLLALVAAEDVESGDKEGT